MVEGQRSWLAFLTFEFIHLFILNVLITNLITNYLRIPNREGVVEWKKPHYKYGKAGKSVGSTKKKSNNE